MDDDTLNGWAAEFTGEDSPEMIKEIKASKYFTTNFASAMGILAAMFSEGVDFGVEIEGDSVEVEVGEMTETGGREEAARLVVKACYRYHNG